jgi:hypothetical protein
VFPKSWYPDTTPAGTSKTKVPSCPPCNHDRWARAEEVFAQEYLLVLDGTRPELAGAGSRLTRAWQAQTAKNSKDAARRRGKAMNIARTMKWVAPVLGAPIATVRTPAGLYVRASPLREIQPTIRRAIAEKFIRGFHFAETGTPAGDFEFECFVRTNAALAREKALQTIVSAMEVRDHLAPGLLYGWFDGPDSAWWAFQIWGQLNLFVKTAPSLGTTHVRRAGRTQSAGAPTRPRP